jgi:ABC-type transporter Mla subunit MlaD
MSKTPRGTKMSARFKSNIFEKEKGVTLLQIAEELENLVSKLNNNKTDLNHTVGQLKNIILSIYRIINENEKVPIKIKSNEEELRKKVQELEEEIKRDKKEIDSMKEHKSKDTSKDASQEAPKLNLNLNNNNVVNLNKEELLNNLKLEQYNFTNSCNNLIYYQNKEGQKIMPLMILDMSKKLKHIRTVTDMKDNLGMD